MRRFGMVFGVALLLAGAGLAQEEQESGFVWCSFQIDRTWVISNVSDREPRSPSAMNLAFRRYLRDRIGRSTSPYCLFTYTREKADESRRRFMVNNSRDGMTMEQVSVVPTAEERARPKPTASATSDTVVKPATVASPAVRLTAALPSQAEREADERQELASYAAQRARDQREMDRVARINAERQAAHRAAVERLQAEHRARKAAADAQYAAARAEWAAQVARCQAGEKKSCGSRAVER